MIQAEPLVSVITPVYNTEKYITACIESVLAQTYQNWEYVIVDNCSTDGSYEIAQRYADQDPRIRVERNTRFLDLMPNWNHAMRQVSPDSTYCKIVHADDWLFPECISKMVEVAELNSTIGIVGAYRLDEDNVNLDGLPYPSTVVNGREICRLYFLQGLFLFGSPTSLLIRSRHIRERDPFYNESNIHADVEVCIDILREADFGYVHQVLTFTRRHNESETTFTRRFQTQPIGILTALTKYGNSFLNHDEYNSAYRSWLDNHYKTLGYCVLLRKDKKFWNYHKQAMKKMGSRLRLGRLSKFAFIALYNQMVNKMKIGVKIF